MPDKQGPNEVVNKCSKRLTGRFHQLEAGHCRRNGASVGQKSGRQPNAGGVNTDEHSDLIAILKPIRVHLKYVDLMHQLLSTRCFFTVRI